MLEINFPAKPLDDRFQLPKSHSTIEGLARVPVFAILFGADVIHASQATKQRLVLKNSPFVSQTCVLLQEMPWLSGFGEGKSLLWRG